MVRVFFVSQESATMYMAKKSSMFAGVRINPSQSIDLAS